MQNVIEFPRRNVRVPLWKFTSSRDRCMSALRFLFGNLRGMPVQPRRMFIMYEMEEDENNTIYFVNLGYKPDSLTDAIGELMQNQKHWEDDE